MLKNNARWGAPPAFALPLTLAVGAVVTVLVILLQARLMPAAAPTAADAPAAVAARGDVYVSEVMASNKSAISDDTGACRDWIEVGNATDKPVDLAGWSLTDDENAAAVFTFPSHVLQPGEFALVFASGQAQGEYGQAYHAPFKISAYGETLFLLDPEGNAAETIELPEMGGNQVYARDGAQGEWRLTGEYTPYLANTSENYASLQQLAPISGSTLVVNEIMADNATYARAQDGGYYDWIELRNIGSGDMSLGGYSITDDPAKPKKWVLPNVTLAAGDVMLIYASGLDRADGELHCNFKLSSDGENVLVYNAREQLVANAAYTLLDTDRSLSRLENGAYITTLSPTPGEQNNEAGFRLIDRAYQAANSSGLYITEACASTRVENIDGASRDWVEIYNASSSTVDLSGWGLSDRVTRPRKWQFPDGASIGAGQYLVVYLSGTGKCSVSKGIYSTTFKLSLAGLETVTLCTPEGLIVDRCPLSRQYGGISYGRKSEEGGFWYFPQPTPGSANTTAAYAGKTTEVTFSHDGGVVSEQSVTLELSCEEGARIYYTLDCTEPTEASYAYSGALTVDKTTVVRAAAYKDGFIPSYSSSRTYIFGASHDLPVACVVTEPDNLWSDEKGIYVKGPNALKEFPYGSINKGANFWMRWERAASIELYSTEGEKILSQNMGIALHGQYSRTEDQKAFSLTARAEYGDSLFRAKLFPNRDYTEYKSFLLRSSGNDVKYAHMTDSILTTFAEGTTVMYQDCVPVTVYLNGEYWGQYNMRERINPYSIAQWEGWDDPENIDLVKANRDTRQGSNESFEELLAWIKDNGIRTAENLAYVSERVDVYNYLDYVMTEMYVGNQDLLNVKRYRNAVSGDGKWRWILFDLDWAFWTLDTNSVRRWLNKGGAGTDNKTDNTLFRLLMENEEIEDWFFTRFGERMISTFDPDLVLEKINTRYNLIYREMNEYHLTRWGISLETWNGFVNKIRNYAQKRPQYILSYIQETMKFSNEKMRHYFGETMDKIGYKYEG